MTVPYISELARLLRHAPAAVRLRPRDRAPLPAAAATRPEIWGHQGANGYAPSNTLESFHLAVSMGVDVLETDVQITRDGVLVLSHDETVDRMTDGHGRIEDLTLADLATLDAGARFVSPDGTRWAGRGVRIPTLDAFFETFTPVEGGRLRFSLDLKTSVPPMEKAVWETIRRYGLEDRVIVSSFHQEAIDAFRNVSGGRVATGGAPDEMRIMAGMWKSGLSSRWEPTMDLFVIPISAGGLRTDDPTLLALAARRGIRVIYWTINDEAVMRRLLDIGAGGIVTDFPDRAMRVMKALGMR